MYNFLALIVSRNLFVNTVKPVLSNHTTEAQKVAAQGRWLLKAGGCLIKVNISTKLTFGNIFIGCFRQIGCLIEVNVNTGLTV